MEVLTVNTLPVRTKISLTRLAAPYVLRHDVLNGGQGRRAVMGITEG